MMSAWAELWAAAASLTAAESDKSTAITKKIRNRIANLLRGDPILQCSGYYHKPKVLKITQPQSVRLKAADVLLQRSERCSRRSRESSRLQPDDL